MNEQPQSRPPGRPKTETSSTNAASKPTTRKADSNHSKQWKLVVGSPILENFPATKLPTKKLVIQRYNTLRMSQPSVTSSYWYAETIFCELKPIWEKSNIPIVDDKVCKIRIQTIIQSWNKKRCRSMKSQS